MDIKDPVAAAAASQAPAQDDRKKIDPAPPEREIREIAPGFYVSPLLKYDTEVSALIFQVRDGESGKVERQFPSESRLEILKHNAVEEKQVADRDARASLIDAEAADRARDAEAVVRENALGPTPAPAPTREAETTRQMTHGAASGPNRSDGSDRVDVTA